MDRFFIVLLIIAFVYSFSTLQPAQPQIPSEPGGAVLHPTGQAYTKSGKLIDVNELDKKDGDFYVKATSLLSQTDFTIIQKNLSKIVGNVPGGLVFDGTPPYYQAFSSHAIVPLSFWPENAKHLLGITLDGKKGFVDENENKGASFKIDFSTGELTSYPTLDPRSSPDAAWIVLPGLSTNSAVARNTLEAGADVPLCSPYTSTYRWSHDSKKLLAINGSEHLVYIIDMPTGNCSLVKLSGLDWNTEVLIAPDNQSLVIVLPGDKQNGVNARVMTAAIDGSSQKKISDLPTAGRNSSDISLVSPDGSSVYVDGYVVDLKTGDYAPTPAKAIGWLKSPPPSDVMHNLQISVDPLKAERGTRFRFKMVGGPIGQEITWYLSRLPDKQNAISKNILRIGSNGALDDSQKTFGFDTELATEAGDYYVMVYIGEKKIGSGTFTITEP